MKVTLIDRSEENSARFNDSFGKTPYNYSAELDQYYRLINEKNIFRNYSFIVENEKELAICCLVTSHEVAGKTVFSYLGNSMFYVENPSSYSLASGRALFKKHFRDLILGYASRRLIYTQRDLDCGMNVMSRMLLDDGANVQIAFENWLDVRPDMSVLRSGLTKSFRSCVNWGLKNLDVQVHFGPDRLQMFDAFRKLHFSAAGRITRSDESWAWQRNEIAEKRAFLVTGSQGERLVTGGLFLLKEETCVYAVAASDRALFDRPVGHAVIWRAIEFAKKMGSVSLKLGDNQFPFQNPSDDKAVAISRFKRSFGGIVRPLAVISLEC